jgi:hypothetical protein
LHHNSTLHVLHRGLALAAALLVGASQAATSVTWQAGLAVFPDQLQDSYRLVIDQQAERPRLGPKGLLLATGRIAQNVYYQHDGPSLDMPESLQIEFGMRFVSGASNDPDRAPAAVFFSTAPGVGNALYIGADSVFLLGPGGRRAAGVAVDTQSGAHDYRIAVTGRGSGSAVHVFQDGKPILSGATFSGSTWNGQAPRVGFGEMSIKAAGTSEWTYVTHNAGAAPRAPAAGGPEFADLVRQAMLPPKATALPPWRRFDMPGIRWKTPAPVPTSGPNKAIGPLMRQGTLVLTEGGQPSYRDNRKKPGEWQILALGNTEGVVEWQLSMAMMAEETGASVDALQKAGFKLRARCEPEGVSSGAKVWLVGWPERSPMVVIEEWSGGSGGRSTSITVPYTRSRVAAAKCY